MSDEAIEDDGDWEDALFQLPEYANALFFGVWRETARVFWNRNQKVMSERGEDDPKIDGLTVRSFCWDDGPDSRLPNFSFRDVDLRWHKYPGRSMTSNVEKSPEQWVDWFEAAMVSVRASEKLCGHCGETCDGSCRSHVADDGDVECAL